MIKTELKLNKMFQIKPITHKSVGPSSILVVFYAILHTGWIFFYNTSRAINMFFVYRMAFTLP